MTVLRTIGYEGATLAAFLAALAQAGVTTLIDVRDAPISRKKGFSKTDLAAALRTAGFGEITTEIAPNMSSYLLMMFILLFGGAILIGAQREFCRSWKNQTEVSVRGRHFLQEDSPTEIGQAIADWLDKLPGQATAQTAGGNNAGSY